MNASTFIIARTSCVHCVAVIMHHWLSACLPDHGSGYVHRCTKGSVLCFRIHVAGGKRNVMLTAVPLVGGGGGGGLSPLRDFARIVRFCWISSEDVTISEEARMFSALVAWWFTEANHWSLSLSTFWVSSFLYHEHNFHYKAKAEKCQSVVDTFPL
jgi:hypothetical protein